MIHVCATRFDVTENLEKIWKLNKAIDKRMDWRGTRGIKEPFWLFQNISKETNENQALFSSLRNPKSFQDSLSHRILRHMHEALNIDENKN